MRNKSSFDLSGKHFGRWTVLKYVGGSKWECKCECGNVRYVSTHNLVAGLSVSCGCFRRDATISRSTTHGMNKTPLHSRWLGMKDRCYNPREESFANYGARGITVCDEWRDNFQAFYDWSISNGFNQSLSLDRIDNNGPYAPWNCRWVDRATQNRNTRRNRLVTVNGRTQTIMDWAIEKGVWETLIRRRLNAGWDAEKAVNTPPRPMKRRGKVLNENLATE